MILKFFTILFTLLVTAQAKSADILVSCSHLWGNSIEIGDIRIAVTNSLSATVHDDEDSSSMICEEQLQLGLPILVCEGNWNSDGSPSLMEINPSLPMTTVTLQRSGNRWVGGICIE